MEEVTVVFCKLNFGLSEKHDKLDVEHLIMVPSLNFDGLMESKKIKGGMPKW